MTDKYQQIINKDPKKSLDKSIDTKQSWQKYRFNYKQGMKRRDIIDNLTNNEEDRFGFKERTKKDYSLSSSRIGKCLRLLNSVTLERPILDIYKGITINYIEQYNSIFGKVYSSDGIYLGTVEFTEFEENPDYIKVENIKKNNNLTVSGFANAVFSTLQDDWYNSYKGIVLLPLNFKLKSLYESLGFKYYIKTDDGSTYYRKVW